MTFDYSLRRFVHDFCFPMLTSGRRLVNPGWCVGKGGRDRRGSGGISCGVLTNTVVVRKKRGEIPNRSPTRLEEMMIEI